MRVLLINAVCDTSTSTGRNTTETAEYIESHGGECFVAYSQGSASYAKCYHIGNKADRKIHAFLSRFFGLPGYFSHIPTFFLNRYIDDIRPDVVHLGNLHSNAVHIPMLLRHLASRNIPVVITLHDCFFYTGKCCHYTSSRCDRWKSGCSHCPRLRSDNTSWFLDRTAGMHRDKKMLMEKLPALAVIGVSDWITEEAAESFVFRHTKNIQRIYNWVDLDVFHPHETTKKDEWHAKNKFVILGVSSKWCAGTPKFDGLLRLSDMLDDTARIVLIGHMKSKTALPENVISVGMISDISDLADCYAAADVFVNLSEEEAFSKVVSEAIACGTPVVVYNKTASPEHVKGGRGYAVECGDIAGVYASIQKIRTAGKAVYSQNCIDHARSHFDQEVCLKQYWDVYSSLSKITTDRLR